MIYAAARRLIIKKSAFHNGRRHLQQGEAVCAMPGTFVSKPVYQATFLDERVGLLRRHSRLRHPSPRPQAPSAAVMRAEALSRKPGCAGALALSGTGDPSTAQFGDAKPVRKFKDVPEDLSAL
jgi:hypothetical protein